MRRFLLLAVLVSIIPSCMAQQLVQRGAFGRPTAILDSTGQWTDAIRVLAAPDVDMYIPDVSASAWLQRHYQEFQDRGQYQITMVTHYKSPRACKANQTGWGLADAAHLNACETDIAYRVRRAVIDTNLKSVTLLQAGMIDPDGNLDPSSVQDQSLVRRWAELDPNTQTALQKTTDLVTRVMQRYNKRVQSSR